jgi:hypothetical protein
MRLSNAVTSSWSGSNKPLVVDAFAPPAFVGGVFHDEQPWVS